MRTFDQIIDANMTVTDQLLRQAIHAVMVDLLYEVREDCARICDKYAKANEESDIMAVAFDHCASEIRGEEL